MLIEFRVGNYRSFKEPVTFSMVAASISEFRESNVFSIKRFDLLKSAVIYGANASGKSNLLTAMRFMRWFILNSSKETQIEERIEIENFRLSSETEGEPSYFEMVFISNHKKYRYGFEVDKTEVLSEWLFCAPTRQEAELFVRTENEIKVGNYFKEGKGLEEKTRPNALFLSVVAQFNGEISTNILKWFRRFHIISGLGDPGYLGLTIEKLEDQRIQKRILKLLNVADLNIHGIEVEKTKIPIQDIPDQLKELFTPLTTSKIDVWEGIERIAIQTSHRKYNENGEFVSTEEFDLSRNESQGTEKFFAMLGPLLDVLDDGKILVVDELDARFHPFITRFIVQLFNSNKTNPNNAQLIFATHDTNLLTNELFRRDQIWFAEKNEYEATDLYSLVEYKVAEKKVRKDASYQKDYVLGKYGAIPFIGNFEILLGDDNGTQE